MWCPNRTESTPWLGAGRPAEVTNRAPGYAARGVLEHMMVAVQRYEGTVNQVMGDGIMALFGAPAHEDHAVRACDGALRTQAAVKTPRDGYPKFREYCSVGYLARWVWRTFNLPSSSTPPATAVR